MLNKFYIWQYIMPIIVSTAFVIKVNAQVYDEIIYFVDYSDYSDYPFYVMDYTPTMENGVMKSSNPIDETTGEASSWYQFFVADGIKTAMDETYKVTIRIKGSTTGNVVLQMRWDWDHEPVSYNIPIQQDWTEVNAYFVGIHGASSCIIFQSNDYVGEIQWEWLKVSRYDSKKPNILVNGNAEDEYGDMPCAYGKEDISYPHEADVDIVDGNKVFVVHATDKREEAWDNQFWICSPKAFYSGDVVKIAFKYKASKEASVGTQAHWHPGNYNHWLCIGTIDFTSEWKTFYTILEVTEDMMGWHDDGTEKGFLSIAFNLSDFPEANDYYFDDLEWVVLEDNSDVQIKWESLLINGDAEDLYSDVSCIGSQENGTWQSHSAYIISEDDNHCFVVHADEVVYDDDGVVTWSNQFFIIAPQSFHSGDMIKVSFRYKASQPASASSYAWGDDGYIGWEPIGSIHFTNKWKTFSRVVKIKEEYDGMKTIGFNLNCSVTTPTKFYFDDIIWEVGQPLNGSEWKKIQVLYSEMNSLGCDNIPDLSQGINAITDVAELDIKHGDVVGIKFANKGLKEVPASILSFSSLTKLDLSHNCLSGNAGVLAASIPTLSSLNLSYNQFSDLNPMISPNVTSLDISHQTIDKTVPLNLSELNMEDIATTVPSILLYDHENQTYNPNINLLCTTGETSVVGNDDWAMQLAIYNGNIGLSYVSSNNAYRGESGDVLNVFDVESGSSFKIALNFNQGDANFVGGIDATDLQATILYAFGGYKNYPFNFTAANTYKDETINVQDVICTVNILLAQAASVQTAPMRKAKGASNDVDAETSIYMQDGKIILRSGKPVAAVSLKASGNITWRLEEYGMMQTVSSSNVVGYSLSGMTLPIGETVIGTYTGNTSISHASLADAEAQAVSVAIGENNATGIGSVNDATDGENQFFDMTGRKVNSPNKGVNIKKSGRKTVKVINK